MKKINRLEQWDFFKEVVREHIKNYTIPQYGDAPDDPVEEYDVERCLQQIGKYVARRNSARRGEKAVEQMRDLAKIAHFSCLAFHKVMEPMNDIAAQFALHKVREGK